MPVALSASTRQPVGEPPAEHDADGGAANDAIEERLYSREILPEVGSEHIANEATHLQSSRPENDAADERANKHDQPVQCAPSCAHVRPPTTVSTHQNRVLSGPPL